MPNCQCKTPSTLGYITTQLPPTKINTISDSEVSQTLTLQKDYKLCTIRHGLRSRQSLNLTVWMKTLNRIPTGNTVLKKLTIWFLNEIFKSCSFTFPALKVYRRKQNMQTYLTGQHSHTPDDLHHSQDPNESFSFQAQINLI